MGMLDTADTVFQVRFEVIYGGSGFFMGILDEPNQQPPSAYTFSALRRTLRTDAKTPVRGGMIIKAPLGARFMVGDHGTSDQVGGVFRSFRLFEVTHTLPWTRRVRVVDPVTRLEKDTGEQAMGDIMCAYEPDSKEASGGDLRSMVETGRIITASPVALNDGVGEYRVVRADQLLGLRICNVN